MNIINLIKEVWNRMFGKSTITQALGRTSNCMSSEMSNAVDLWMLMYQGKSPWLTHNSMSLGLPVGITSEIARLVTLEAVVDLTGVKGEQGVIIQDNEDRAEFLSNQISFILDNLKLYTEYACAGGGLFFKPYVNGDRIDIDCVQATSATPLSFDSRGRITSAAFLETQVIKGTYYRRLETHTLETGGRYLVTNQAYKASQANELGNPIGLTEVPSWAELEASITLANIKQPLFSYFKIPLGNTIDPTSPLGVSVFSRAVNLIADADKQYQRLMWEFEGGELAIDVSEDVLMKERGKLVLPQGKERLFRPNKFKSDDDKALMVPFSPTLRDQSYLNGLNHVIQRIEFLCGLAYGTISDPNNVERTATEIKVSRQRSYSTVNDIQKSLRVALEDLIYSIDTLTTLYELAPEGEFNLSFNFDDSIIVDAESERLRDMSEVGAGLMKEWEYRVKWHGESEREAKQALGIAEEEAKTDEEILFGELPEIDAE